jgi:hypothetical protein
MTPKQRLFASVAGTVGVAICCFTPVLAITLVAVGLGAFSLYLDVILLPGAGNPDRGYRAFVPPIRPREESEWPAAVSAVRWARVSSLTGATAKLP